MFLIWKPKILVGIWGNVLDRLRYCCLHSDVGWIWDWVCCDECEWSVTWHMMCWPWCHTRDDVTTLDNDKRPPAILTHLIEWPPDTSHIRIFGARERDAERSHASAVQSCIHGSASFTSNKRFAKTFTKLMCRQKRLHSRLQSMRSYLAAMFNSMNYELGKSTRGHKYIFRRTQIWVSML